MQAKNFLFILSDQHHRLFSGAYGHPTVQTPHLDALPHAARVFKMPIPTVQSASLNARLWQRATTCIKSDSGTTAIPMTAPCLLGTTICAHRATPAIRLANCTSKEEKAITAFVAK